MNTRLSIHGCKDNPYCFGKFGPVPAPVEGDMCDPSWIEGTLSGTIPSFVQERLSWFGFEGYIKPEQPNNIYVRKL